jgi:hypothetical protein
MVVLDTVILGIDSIGVLFIACCLRWGFPPWEKK